MRLRDRLPTYLAEQGLPEHGGQEGHIDWITAFGLRWPVPNPPIRKAILPKHDAHHLITGYETDAIGEAEVGAWALGATGPQPLLGLVYDQLAIGLGMLQAPVRTTRAFYAGRGCQTVYDIAVPTLLDTDLADLRAHTRIDTPRLRHWTDHVAFAKTLALAVVMPMLAPLLMLVVVLQRPSRQTA